ncbi:MAG TPA: YggS family pyridoxal phosphate-dependent enzyme [Deltaproteobacteria bacterium]|nr:YggS family pyridoxal phosphate-dependent enzyme [Deltaproteobacteria bacterium]
MEETLALLRAAPREAEAATRTALAERLLSVRTRMASAAQRVGRDPGEITLIGVSKRVDASRVAEAVSLGLTDLGENYVQEARGKIAAVREILRTSKVRQAPRWHGIGQLQRNKAREAVLLFDVILAVDRIELARELDRRAGQAGRRLEVFLQVNLSGEPQKGGVRPGSLDELAAECAKLTHLSPIGLMTVPAESPDPQAARPAFAALRELARGLRENAGGDRFVALSMGMSHDFEVAIEEGATHIRVGTALFGPRES